MLKVLHTADIHLGMKFPGLGIKGEGQRRQIEETFKKIIALAILEKADVLLIAGDLFDSNQQSQKVIDLVISQFKMLQDNNIPVCLIPGNHDCFDATSIYRKVNFAGQCPNLTIFTGTGVNYQEFPDIGLTVYGNPNLSDRESISPLHEIKKQTASRYHVALVHGSFFIPEKVAKDDHIFTAGEIADSGMDYLALGHWHTMGNYSSGPVAASYSGSPEWLDYKQQGRGKVILANILDNGNVAINEKTVGLRYSDTLEINMAEINNWPDLEKEISRGADTNLVRTITLKGLRNSGIYFNPDSIEKLKEDLSPAFFNLRIEDSSTSPILNISPDRYAEQPIVARFIELSRKRMDSATSDEERKIAEDAMQYGVALLENRV